MDNIEDLKQESKKLKRACMWRTVLISGFSGLAFERIGECYNSQPNLRSIITGVGSTAISLILASEVILLNQELNDINAQLDESLSE